MMLLSPHITDSFVASTERKRYNYPVRKTLMMLKGAREPNHKRPIDLIKQKNPSQQSSSVDRTAADLSNHKRPRTDSYRDLQHSFTDNDSEESFVTALQEQSSSESRWILRRETSGYSVSSTKTEVSDDLSEQHVVSPKTTVVLSAVNVSNQMEYLTSQVENWSLTNLCALRRHNNRQQQQVQAAKRHVMRALQSKKSNSMLTEHDVPDDGYGT